MLKVKGARDITACQAHEILPHPHFSQTMPIFAKQGVGDEAGKGILDCRTSSKSSKLKHILKLFNYSWDDSYLGLICIYFGLFWPLVNLIPWPHPLWGKGSGDIWAFSWFLLAQHSCFRASHQIAALQFCIPLCNTVQSQLSCFITNQSERSSTILHTVV